MRRRKHIGTDIKINRGVIRRRSVEPSQRRRIFFSDDIRAHDSGEDGTGHTPRQRDAHAELAQAIIADVMRWVGVRVREIKLSVSLG